MGSSWSPENRGKVRLPKYAGQSLVPFHTPAWVVEAGNAAILATKLRVASGYVGEVWAGDDSHQQIQQPHRIKTCARKSL
jgi:hypothetical protein